MEVELQLVFLIILSRLKFYDIWPFRTPVHIQTVSPLSTKLLGSFNYLSY